MANRGDASGLELGESRDHLVPGCGNGDAICIENSLVRPDPVGRMHVDRGRNPLAVMLGERLERGGHHIVPAFLGGEFVQVRQRALIGPVENIKTKHLNCRRCVARSDACAQHRHRLLAAAARDRHILPANALPFQIALQNVERRRFAAGCPPVQNFDALGVASGERRAAAERKRSCGQCCHRRFHRDSSLSAILCS